MTTKSLLSISKIVIVFICSIMVSGCASMTQISSMMPKNPFASKSKEVAVASPISDKTMLAAAKEVQSTTSVMPSRMKGCPKLKIWPTGKILTIYQKGQVGNNLAIRHRGEISKVARECALGAGNLTVKFGVSGRVLLGPKGVFGKKLLPMLVYVTDQTGKKIMTQKLKVAVNIAQGKPFGYFSSVNRITFRVPPKSTPNKLKLYVAFDNTLPNAS